MTTPAAPAPDSTAAHSGKRSRWPITFSLRTLLIVTTLAGVLLGRAVYFHRQREEAAQYFAARQINLHELYHLKIGAAGWVNEASYLLTGKASWLRVRPAGATSSYHQLRLHDGPWDHSTDQSQFLPLDAQGVQMLRIFHPFHEKVAVDATFREMKGTDAVLAAATPIPIASLDMPAHEPRWLKLFAPRDCRLWGCGNAELAAILEADCPHTALHVLNLDQWAENFAAKPKLCAQIFSAVCDAGHGNNVAVQRNVLRQAHQIKQLTIRAIDLTQAVEQLGPFPPSLEELLLYSPGGRAYSGLKPGLGAALKKNLGQRTQLLEVQVVLPPLARPIDDYELQELRSFPGAIKLRVDAGTP